ncbi:ATP-binding cassette domain-containing protein [Microbacterium sp. ZW T5_56]|uniref:ABC transporter ATP-binding protein n=1 Tax=Microbacterium sp. ZW T5_56 TaxID=3378081 RepID=UPI003853AF7B
MITAEQATVTLDGITLLPPTDLDVPSGSVCVLRGRNGSGKTTLLTLVAGRRRPTQGSVRVAHEEADDRSRAFRTRVAALLDPPPVARDLTVREQLTLIALTWAATAPEDAADAELARWGIEELATRFPHELSSGQRRLFHLATTWIRPAEIVILDEPEQRLDDERRRRLITNIDERRRAGTTFLIASHDDDVEAAADVVVRIAA